MRLLASVATLALLLATPGCLQAGLNEGEALLVGSGPAAEGYAEQHFAEATVPLWVGTGAGRYVHFDAAEQFAYNVTAGLTVAVAEARWTPTSPAAVNTELKLLVLGPDRTILAEVEGISPLRAEVPGDAAIPGAPLTVYVVGAEGKPALTKDQPYELALTLFYGREAGEGFTAFE